MAVGVLNGFWQVLTLLAGFVFGIYVAVFLHECGHALGAVLNGDKVYAIVMQIPAPAGYVQASNSSPMNTWGGVIFGSLFSLVSMLFAYVLPATSMTRFAALMVTALCLAHNGLYLSVGAIAPFSDAAGMIAYGAPRWLLFVLGIPLLIGFVITLSHTIGMIGLRPTDSLRKYIVIAELGLLPIPAIAVVAAVAQPGGAHGATTLPMALWGAAYAAGFAIAAQRARSLIMVRTTDLENAQLRQHWRVPSTLFLLAVVVIALEWLLSRPV
jgi:hypothetical protein